MHKANLTAVKDLSILSLSLSLRQGNIKNQKKKKKKIEAENLQLT